jgi:hypothetical protein
LRHLQLPKEFDLFPAAKLVLEEFGGLTFSEVDGQASLEPSLGREIETRIRAYETLLGKQLYPLGKIDGSDVLYIVLDDTGYVYTITDRLEPFASSFDQAIKYIARVCAYKPDEFKRDLESVGLFGKHWEYTPRKPAIG